MTSGKSRGRRSNKLPQSGKAFGVSDVGHHGRADDNPRLPETYYIYLMCIVILYLISRKVLVRSRCR